MPKERDIEQVRSVIRKYQMTDAQIDNFSDYLHDCKREGFRGSKNQKGDFTYQELCNLAEEFLENQG